MIYETIKREDFDQILRNNFGEMLRKQGKVRGDFDAMADRCNLICLAKINNDVVGIGAIKQKTKSDFSNNKADLESMEKEFDWELGYFYTENQYLGRGIASNITRILIEAYGDNNLMASTEINNNPAMVKIFEKNGFRLFGKPWKSVIHDHYLGLFLKLK